MEFDQVKRELGRYLVSAAGKRELATLTPSADHDQIQYWLDETTDGADILRLTGGIPIPKLKNIQPQLKRLRINANLNGTELAQITKVLQTSMSVKNFFAEFKEQQKVELRVINESVQQLITIPTITKRLIQSIDPDGRVTDEASTKLHGIRQLISKTEAEIHQRMERFTQGKNAKYLSDAIVTVRNDRYVVPVLARYRNKFGGVVHDQSASGQTLYIEPAAVVEYNNRLRQAQIEEKQAILEVLAELSALISPYRSEIAANAKILGHLDFINAKARFARDHKDSLPLLSPDNQVIIRQARHPLIDPQKVVANDIKIGDEYQSIVITGPNTGGKTITLKTFGLIQMMGQAGLFIPAQEGSTIAVFDNIYADIGDEQSLEQNLSTFSGHMENVKSILRFLGITNGSGAQDITRIINVMIEQGITFDNINFHEIFRCDDHGKKIILQRIRRDLKTGLNNLAHMCIDYPENDIILEYANNLFEYKNVHNEMKIINDTASRGGQVSVKHFFNGLVPVSYTHLTLPTNSLV